jgi:hypothetical protein
MPTQGLTELRKEYKKICIDAMSGEEWHGMWICLIMLPFGYNHLIWCKLLIEPDHQSHPCGAKLEPA